MKAPWTKLREVADAYYYDEGWEYWTATVLLVAMCIVGFLVGVAVLVAAYLNYWPLGVLLTLVAFCIPYRMVMKSYANSRSDG